MRLSAYRDFHKAVRRIWLLYQATMYSYTNMYEVGRKLLRDPSARNESIELVLDMADDIRAFIEANKSALSTKA